MSDPAYQRVLATLVEDGLLLLTDRTLPSVASLVAGEPIRGSWWGHPRGNDIYHVAGAIEDHPDVAECKLVDGKVTYVHRRLWPALLGLGWARDSWQMQDLSDAARHLLQRVHSEGEVHVKPADRTAARELERRLLVHTYSVHTDRGAHARVLQTWDRWANRLQDLGPPPFPAEARQQLEECLAAINLKCGGTARLPWQSTQKKRAVRRSLLLIVGVWMLLGSLVGASPSDSFDGGWTGQPAAVAAVVRGWQASRSTAARDYLAQTDIDPSINDKTVLRKSVAARRTWARLGPGLAPSLVPFLSSPHPWERFVVAVLLGGTRCDAAARALLQRSSLETHRDVGYAIEGALAEVGDHPVDRTTRLVHAEWKEKDRHQAMMASHRYDEHALRDPEIRCGELISLAGNVHRREVQSVLQQLHGDDGALGEAHSSILFYFKADLHLLSPGEMKRLGI